MAWTIVAERKSCKGDAIEQSKSRTISECARKCMDLSSMFIVGTNDFGAYGCFDGQCECFCETLATMDGSCELSNDNKYRLYKYYANGIMYFRYLCQT